MDAVADGSVALVVTSPPYFAGKQYEEELERDGVPALLPRVPRAARATCSPTASACSSRAGASRSTSPTSDASRTGACRPTSSASCRTTSGCCCAVRSCGARSGESAPPVRVGLVPQCRQPGAARRHRAGRDREQGPLRPGQWSAGARRSGLPLAARSAPTSSWPPRSTCGTPARERPAGAAPGTVPGRAAGAADPALHLRGRPRARPVHGLGIDPGRRGPARPALRRLRPRPRVRRPGPRPGRGACRPRRPRRPTAARPATALAAELIEAAGFTITHRDRKLRGTGLTVRLRRHRLPTVGRGTSTCPACSPPRATACSAPTPCGSRSAGRTCSRTTTPTASRSCSSRRTSPDREAKATSRCVPRGRTRSSTRSRCATRRHRPTPRVRRRPSSTRSRVLDRATSTVAR